VKAGTLLAQLDTTDAQKAVRDAQLALDNARISLEKFKIDQGTSQQNRTDSLEKSYEDGLNQISNAFSELVDIMNGANDVLYGDTLKGSCSPNVCEYGNRIADIDELRAFNQFSHLAEDDFTAAEVSYESALSQYRELRLLDIKPETLKPTLDNTLSTLRLAVQAVKSEQNMIDALISDINEQNKQAGAGVSAVPAQITTYQKNLASFFGTLNSCMSGVSGSISSIRSQEQAITSAGMGDPLDLTDQENLISQKEAALSDANDNLAHLYIRAPFAGTVANVAVEKGDSVSSGTVVATMITNQSIAEISLNEVDAAKVQVGQKATLTFDAITDLTITGEVSEIDTLGTVSQGVVTYTVKINFDTQDTRVKPGMSVSADIITNAKQNVLMVPNSAIKSAGGTSYVEVPQDATVASQLMANTANSATGIILNPAPSQQAVEIGLSNDSVSEVTSGLKAGDLVITRTITPSSATTTTQTQSTQTRSIFGGSSGGSTRNVIPLRGD
jgi:HlyD family secretion protein